MQVYFYMYGFVKIFNSVGVFWTTPCTPDHNKKPAVLFVFYTSSWSLFLLFWNKLHFLERKIFFFLVFCCDYMCMMVHQFFSSKKQNYMCTGIVITHWEQLVCVLLPCLNDFFNCHTCNRTNHSILIQTSIFV